ncbi:MAG: Hpt domain-containing protein, partial [Deltaproteobacteria bacterium]|nr:Hpt domain-containing protein [Nannocystaceae bacterium]
STWIVAKEETHGEGRAAFLRVQSELVQRVLQGRDVVGGLTRQSPSILDVAHCGGAALRYENEIHIVGATPPASAIDALLAWIETQDTQTFVSHSLPAQYPPALAWKDLACGVIATSISFGESSIVRQRIWLIWCRPEVVRTVSWAGDPTKSAPSAPGERLSPRTSFERWKQDVHLESVPFAPPDVDAARSLASALVDVILEIEAGRRIRESASLLGSAHRSLQLREASLQLVLDSIGEGIIAVGLDGCLMSERSRAVEQWFAKASDGAQIWDVLFADGAARDYFRASWDQLVEEVLPFELAVDQMPHSITHDDRSFELDFKDVRVGGALVSVLLRIQDVTERVAARKRALEADEAHSVLAMVLRDARGFARSLVELDALLEAVRSAAAPADARRALHTLKGSAAVLGLRALAQRCHELEDRLAAPGPRGAVSDPDVGAIEDELARIHDRIDELVGKDGLQRVDIPMAELTDVIATAEHGGELTAVLAQLRRWTLEPVTRQLGNLAERARQLSQNLGKRVEVRVVGGDVRVDADRFEPLWAALAHAVANAVDHGIESITVRDECGKDVCGHIVISVEAAQQRLTISVADDGGGVDLEATRVVARRRGLPSATRRELLDALFADELSTRRGVTSTSGRGVGLAALRTTCARLGGTVEIDSEPGLGTTLQVQLPIAALPS